ERHGAALVLEVLDAELDGEYLRVTRDLGRGAGEVLRVRGPAVLVMSEDAPPRLYVSRHRRLVAAGRVGPVTPAVAAAPRWEPPRPRTRATDLAGRTGGTATDRMNALVGAAAAMAPGDADAHVVIADAATCAKHLLRYLAHHGFITRRVEAVPGVAA